MADTANVDVILETSFDAHVYEERLKINRSDQMPKVVIQKSEPKGPFSSLCTEKWIGFVYFQLCGPSGIQGPVNLSITDGPFPYFKNTSHHCITP